LIQAFEKKPMVHSRGFFYGFLLGFGPHPLQWVGFDFNPAEMGGLWFLIQ
jgi:hypothetical protein